MQETSKAFSVYSFSASGGVNPAQQIDAESDIKGRAGAMLNADGRLKITR